MSRKYSPASWLRGSRAFKRLKGKESKRAAESMKNPHRAKWLQVLNNDTTVIRVKLYIIFNRCSKLEMINYATMLRKAITYSAIVIKVQLYM